MITPFKMSRDYISIDNTTKHIKIVICRDKFQKWMAVNPIIKEKELIAVVFPNKVIKYKIGDGKNHFRNLPFVKLYISSVVLLDVLAVKCLIS